jgi:hypothetical protein
MLPYMLAAGFLLQLNPAAPPTDEAFDSPATRALVERVIRESGEIPPGLRDFAAQVRTTVHLSMAPDSALGGEVPLTVDEFASEVRWRRPDVLHQWIREHRTRVLVPVPYSLGTMLESPWVIPHLYGPTIDALTLATGAEGRGRAVSRAVHPFGPGG